MPKPSLQHNRIIRYDERPPTNRSVPIQSHSYFTRKFQQIYGFPPSQLIKRIGNNK